MGLVASELVPFPNDQNERNGAPVDVLENVTVLVLLLTVAVKDAVHGNWAFTKC